ncbi:10055_t:CDS:1 [Cetraspora pellucida]|uniref:10055_t:CDS:1 n=1 Tax=Cetraspora pellucida TaxID=1433469 RepID=A0ACA9KP44_9GLOM|nr:10055_t:CDS:1 [Cetraspora pellucida]
MSLSNNSNKTISHYTSDIWSYITKLFNNDNILIDYSCKLCSPNQKTYAPGCAISTLHHHLQNKHHETYISFKNELYNITYCLVNWIISDLQPFSVVENSQFHDLIYTLNPKYKIPTRQTIRDLIIKIFNTQ